MFFTASPTAIFVGLAVAPPAQLDTAFVQAFGADGDAQRNADQVGIFELDAGALVAVVEQDFDAGALADLR